MRTWSNNGKMVVISVRRLWALKFDKRAIFNAASKACQAVEFMSRLLGGSEGETPCVEMPAERQSQIEVNRNEPVFQS